MTIEEINGLWLKKNKDTKSTVKWWDHKAASFANKALPTPSDSLAMKIIEENNIISEGKKFLDAGCGSGRFSFALEKMGGTGTGFDISPKMIGECLKAGKQYDSKVDFLTCDWEKADLKELGWEKNFDLVLANMTPAISSAETFLKLCHASKDWCIMVKPTRRTHRVLDEITDMLCLERDKEKLDRQFLYSFELLWDMGLRPYTDYEEKVWEHSFTEEEAEKEFTLKLSAFYELGDAQREKIKSCIKKISSNGLVREQTYTLTSALYWRV